MNIREMNAAERANLRGYYRKRREKKLSEANKPEWFPNLALLIACAERGLIPREAKLDKARAELATITKRLEAARELLRVLRTGGIVSEASKPVSERRAGHSKLVVKDYQITKQFDVEAKTLSESECLARVAAAREECAKWFDKLGCTCRPDRNKQVPEHTASCAIHLALCIRSLTTPAEQAALDKIVEQKTAELREALSSMCDVAEGFIKGLAATPDELPIVHSRLAKARNLIGGTKL